MTKIMLSIFLLWCFSINITHSSEIEKNSSMHQQSLKLTQALHYADELYYLLKRQNILQSQLEEERKKLRNKNVLTRADTIGRALTTGILTTPALALYYSKKYIKPEYHSTINNISFALGGIPVASSSWKLTKKTASSLYDFFMYEKEQDKVKETIAQKVKEISDNQKNTDSLRTYIISSGVVYNTENPIMKDFLRYYQENKRTIDRNTLHTFLTSHPNLTINDLILIFQQTKIRLIMDLYNRLNLHRHTPTSSSWSSMEPTEAIMGLLLLGPLFILGSLLTAALPAPKEQPKTPDISQKSDAIEIINDIIKKLTVLEKE